jgi:hypothetical protein
LSAHATTFTYSLIVTPILSATFSADFAAFTAHRTIGGVEVNSLSLVSGALTDDLSVLLFGTTDALVDPPILDQGVLGTGIVSVPIDCCVLSGVGLGQRRLVRDADRYVRWSVRDRFLPTVDHERQRNDRPRSRKSCSKAVIAVGPALSHSLR